MGEPFRSVFKRNILSHLNSSRNKSCNKRVEESVSNYSLDTVRGSEHDKESWEENQDWRDWKSSRDPWVQLLILNESHVLLWQTFWVHETSNGERQQGMSNRINTINKKIVGGEDTILHSGAKRRLTITLFSLPHFYMSEGEGGDYKTTWSEKKETLRKLRGVGDRLIMLCLLSIPFISIKTKINHHHPLYFLTVTGFEWAGTLVGRITDPPDLWMLIPVNMLPFMAKETLQVWFRGLSWGDYPGIYQGGTV